MSEQKTTSILAKAFGTVQLQVNRLGAGRWQLCRVASDGKVASSRTYKTRHQAVEAFYRIVQGTEVQG